MPKLISVTRTPNSSKAFKAIFKQDSGRNKTIRFGTESNFTMNPNKTEKDRKNYIARHRVNENFNNPMTAGSLSRHLLWGDTRSINKNVASFKIKFKL